MTEFLARSGSATLDATGTGALVFTPGKYGETWNITKYTTSGNSAVAPLCSVYRGVVGSDLLDTTPRGNGDVSETSVTLKAGEHFSVQWTGGTPGKVMEFYLEGEIIRGV